MWNYTDAGAKRICPWNVHDKVALQYLYDSYILKSMFQSYSAHVVQNERETSLLIGDTVWNENDPL